MVELPNTLEEAIAQAKQATLAAIADGQTRVQVEMIFPEIALQAQSIALEFLPVFDNLPTFQPSEDAEAKTRPQVKVFFPDAGAAALARRDWGKDIPYKLEDIGLGRLPIQDKIADEDDVFLLVDPSSVEVGEVEKICHAAGDRPVVLLNPHLEDAGTVGIGYAARQLRERLFSTLFSCYYVRPLQGAAIFRCYPGLWQIWLEANGGYQLLVELPRKPVGEEIDQILMSAIQPTNGNSDDAPKPRKPGIFASMQRFLRALNN
ncbi:DUF1995 family protein [Aerosakkonemataceae cyanobacterium BLCC-F154]|uniref:DUF1995 family protein n=1 Tax=Floridaenema fluviatile BLCC-F154 TaxID=3153640 RepID=A0ABV4YEV2_9CYAN